MAICGSKFEEGRHALYLQIGYFRRFKGHIEVTESLLFIYFIYYLSPGF